MNGTPRVGTAFLELVLTRLERVPVDSALAHRASGIRGSLIRTLEDQKGGIPVDSGVVKQVLETAFVILGQAASGGTAGRRARRPRHS